GRTHGSVQRVGIHRGRDGPPLSRGSRLEARRQRAARRGEGRDAHPDRAGRDEDHGRDARGQPERRGHRPRRRGLRLQQRGLRVGRVGVTGNQPGGYTTGSIQRVDASGAVTTLYTGFPAVDPATQGPLTRPLRGPDDLVFDATGSFWFTDWGKARPRDRDIT